MVYSGQILKLEPAGFVQVLGVTESVKHNAKVFGPWMGLELTKMGKTVGGAGFGEKVEELALAMLDVKVNSQV